MKKPRYTIKLGISLFFFISAITSVFILIKTLNKNTLSSLKLFRIEHFLIIFGLIILNWLLETYKLQVLAKIAEIKLKFKPAFYSALGNIFLSAVTPFQSGGGAIQIYIMYKYGIGPGKSTAISFLKVSLTLFSLGIATPIALLIFPELLDIKMFKTFFVYSLIISLFLLGLYINLLFDPKLLKKIVGFFFKIISKFHLIPKKKRKKYYKHILYEIDEFNIINKNAWKYHKIKLLWGFIISILVLLTTYLIAPVILVVIYRQILSSVALMHLIIISIVIQLVISFIMYFIPTPGGSGAVELGFMAFFQTLIPLNIIGIYTILWRFFSNIFSVIVGAYISIKVMGITEFKTLKSKEFQNVIPKLK